MTALIEEDQIGTEKVLPPQTYKLAGMLKDVEARENGRRTRFQTFSNGRIQFEFTEPINGRDVTRRIDAKVLIDNEAQKWHNIKFLLITIEHKAIG